MHDCHYCTSQPWAYFYTRVSKGQTKAYGASLREIEDERDYAYTVLQKKTCSGNAELKC